MRVATDRVPSAVWSAAQPRGGVDGNARCPLLRTMAPEFWTLRAAQPATRGRVQMARVVQTESTMRHSISTVPNTIGGGPLGRERSVASCR